MNLLAIDTSGIGCSVALSCNDVIFTHHEIAPMQHTQLILTWIDQLCQKHNIIPMTIDAIAFGCGPGSFTGVRVSTSVAQALGFALNKPLISISSLAALAQTTYNVRGWRNLMIAVDARMQEIYWALYHVNDSQQVELQDQERVCLPSAVKFPETPDWYGVGNGWDVYALQNHYRPLALDTLGLPMASAIIQLAKGKYLKQDWLTPSEAMPVYLREGLPKKT